MYKKASIDDAGFLLSTIFQMTLKQTTSWCTEQLAHKIQYFQIENLIPKPPSSRVEELEANRCRLLVINYGNYDYR